MKNMRNKEKLLLRTKSELPKDNETMQALIEHKRADEYLKAPPNANKL